MRGQPPFHLRPAPSPRAPAAGLGRRAFAAGNPPGPGGPGALAREPMGRRPGGEFGPRPGPLHSGGRALELCHDGGSCPKSRSPGRWEYSRATGEKRHTAHREPRPRPGRGAGVLRSDGKRGGPGAGRPPGAVSSAGGDPARRFGARIRLSPHPLPLRNLPRPVAVRPADPAARVHRPRRRHLCRHRAHQRQAVRVHLPRLGAGHEGGNGLSGRRRATGSLARPPRIRRVPGRRGAHRPLSHPSIPDYRAPSA